MLMRPKPKPVPEPDPVPGVRHEIDGVRLRAITDSMLDAITSPAFVAALRAVRATPPERRLAEGSKRLTPQALREAGVPLPPDMRVSSRYFEEGFPGGIEFGDGPEGSTNVVNELNRRAPGLLDSLVHNPREDSQRLVDSILRSQPPGYSPLIAGGCCCGGAASACGGCGGD